MSHPIDALAAEYWAHYLDEQPTCAHLLGDYSRAGRVRVRDPAVRGRRDRAAPRLRTTRRRARRDTLDEQQRITRDVLVDDATNRIAMTEQRFAELAADPIFGIQVEMPIMLGMLALPTAEVAEALVDKLRGLGRYYGELAERQREGVAAGRLPARFAVSGTVEQLDELLATPVADDPLLQTTTPPDGLDVDGWKARLREVIESDVRPAMDAYRDVLRDEVLPQARSDEQCGLSWLPDGDAAYAATLRYFTTTDKTRPGDPRHRPGPDGEAGRRVPRARPRGGRHRRPRADLRGDAHRPQAALRDRRAAGRGLRGRDGAGLGGDAGVVRDAPAGSVRRAVHADRGQGVLLPAGRRRQPRRHLLHQRRRPVVVGHLRAGVDGLPRGHPRPPPAARDRLRARARGAGVPQARPQLGLRRGLGPLHRAALRRDGALLPGRRPDGHVRRRLDARLPPGRRHRPARARLEPRAGGRLHGRPTHRWPRGWCGPRSTATSSRPARRRPTWSGGWRSSGCGPRPSSARATRFSVKAFHSAVLDQGGLPLGVLDEVVRARLP